MRSRRISARALQSLRNFAPWREVYSNENDVAKQIVDVAFNIHQAYGRGLLESVYEAIMAYELKTRGLVVNRQQPIPVVHEDVRMGVGFRADLNCRE